MPCPRCGSTKPKHETGTWVCKVREHAEHMTDRGFVRVDGAVAAWLDLHDVEIVYGPVDPYTNPETNEVLRRPLAPFADRAAVIVARAFVIGRGPITKLERLDPLAGAIAFMLADDERRQALIALAAIETRVKPIQKFVEALIEEQEVQG